MKYSKLKKWAKLYSDTMENISVICTGDSRMGGHSYAAWTNYYTLHYGEKTVDFQVYTGDGDYMVREVKAMIDVGAMPSVFEGYSYSIYLNAYYNLRRLKSQIERAFEREGITSPDLDRDAFSVFNDIEYYNKYSEDAESVISDDAVIADTITGWDDDPCVRNPIPKQWEIDLQEAKEYNIRKRKEAHKRFGAISRRYCIPFETALALKEDEEKYAFLSDLRGALLAVPGRYTINWQSLSSRDWNDKANEIAHLCRDIIPNDKRADAIIDLVDSSETDAYRIAGFFLNVADAQGSMIKERIKGDIVHLVNKTDVFRYGMIPELVDIAYVVGMQAVYCLKKDFEHMPAKYMFPKKHTLLDSSSNRGVTRALYVYAPRYAHCIEKKDITAYSGDILGLSVVKEFVMKGKEPNESRYVSHDDEFEDAYIFYDEDENE